MTSIVNIRGEYGTTDYLAGIMAGGEDHQSTSTPTATVVGHRCGLRLLCMDTGGWIHITYADGNTVDCAAAIRRRVGFLLRNPHIHHPHVLARRVQLRVHRCVVQDRAMGGGFDGGSIFQWRRRWTKARRRGQRVTQQSNQGDGGGGWQQKSSAFNGGDGRWRLKVSAMCDGVRRRRQ